MGNESATQALEKRGHPVSTGMDLLQNAPNQGATLATTVVALDRENLTFFANMIKAAGLVPKVQGVTPEISFNRVMAKIVAGTSYGFDPMLSQTAFHVMFDQLTLSAQGHEILFRRSGEYDTRFLQGPDENGCKVQVLKLVNGAWRAIGEVEFTKTMAQKAGLLANKMYEKFGPDMYFARVMTRVVKRFNPGCLQPTVVLGNHFAKESQANFNLPPAPPAQDQLPAAPVTAASEPEGEAHEDPVYDGAEILAEEIEGEVIEYDQPQDVVETVDAEPIDAAESKLQDLRTAAKELYADMDKPEQKKADEWLGQRLIKNLSTEELSEFLSVHQV